jgi:hypothetical protein
MTKELVISALKMAIANRRPSKGLICHSDYTEKNSMPNLIRIA